MKLLIDTTIFLSALIKDSSTRKIIVESEWEFYYPEISLHEIRKYEDLVLEKTGMNKEEYAKLLNSLLKHINLIPEEMFKQKLDEANNLIGKRDPDDVVFLAAALSIDGSKIWSEDKDYEEQDEVIVLKIKDAVSLFYLSYAKQ